jgi:hypothetical protein
LAQKNLKREKEMSSYNQGLFVVFASLSAAVSIAHASITVVPTNLAIPVTPAGLYINISTGVSSTTASGAPGWDINVGGMSSLNFVSPGGYNFVRLNSAPMSAGPSNLVVGDTISNMMPLASWISGGTSNGFINNSSANYVGFQFVGNDSLTHLGWMQFSIGASATGSDRKIVSYGWNTASAMTLAGSSITVPAPGALALLGLAGFASRRRR